MPKRNLSDERAHAHQLFIHQGKSIPEIADILGVHENSVRSWAKTDDWQKQRDELVVTSVAIADDIKQVLHSVVKEIQQKQTAGELISDILLLRLQRIVKSLSALHSRYDERGLAIVTMKRYTDYLAEIKDFSTLQAVRSSLPDFYRGLLDD